MSDPTPSPLGFPVDDPNDKRPLPETIAARYGFPLAFVDVEDGKRFYAVLDWIRGVAQTANPSGFWVHMKKRLKKMGVQTVTWCHSLPYRASDGKTYKRDHADATGLYLIAQRMDANTGLRNEILQFLAQSGVALDEMRIDPEKAIDAGVRAYKRQGKSDKWIETRLKSKAQRLKFTAAFSKCLRTPPSQWHFAMITDEMRLGLWKRKTADLKKELGLGKEDELRDHFSSLALAYETLAEQIAAFELEQQQGLEVYEARHIVRKRSESVGKHAEETGRELGIDIATGRPLLPDQTADA